MVTNQERLEITSPANVDTRQSFLSALRCLEIEYRWQNSRAHFLSANRPQVESLLLALSQLTTAQKAIQKYVEGETDIKTANSLLAELIANATDLRKRLWPDFYRACEALTRMLGILVRIESSLSALK